MAAAKGGGQGMYSRSNDIILESVTKVVSFIILSFSIYLFFAGHHNPGGGFIGGLMTASAFVLKYLAFDIETIQAKSKFNFHSMIGAGLLIAALTGIGGTVFGANFLSHTFDYFYIPFLGKTELATAVLFDLGVYLVVVGVTMTIILAIGEDD
jgi:monovalent cation:proton antiporter